MIISHAHKFIPDGLRESEQNGFATLVKGLFGTFRNPPAHTARASGEWELTEADALDLSRSCHLCIAVSIKPASLHSDSGAVIIGVLPIACQY